MTRRGKLPTILPMILKYWHPYSIQTKVPIPCW
jgi:hypothetical protein